MVDVGGGESGGGGGARSVCGGAPKATHPRANPRIAMKCRIRVFMTQRASATTAQAVNASDLSVDLKALAVDGASPAERESKLHCQSRFAGANVPVSG